MSETEIFLYQFPFGLLCILAFVKLHVFSAWGRVFLLAIFSNTEQIVFQLRYSHGYSYLDRCGSILNEIERKYTDWVVSNSVSPQGSALLAVSNGCQLNFSSTSIDLSLRRESTDDPISEASSRVFHDQIDEMTTFICDRLDVSKATRIGFRMIFTVPMPSKELAALNVREKNIWKLGSEFLNDIGGTTTSEAMTVEFDLAESSYRLGIQPVEKAENVKLGNRKHAVRMADLPSGPRTKLQSSRNVAKLARQDEIDSWNVPNFVRIDIDAFQDDPQTIDAVEFSRKNSVTITDIAQKINRGFSSW
jgi:hypothetical protein